MKFFIVFFFALIALALAGHGPELNARGKDGHGRADSYKVVDNHGHQPQAHTIPAHQPQGHQSGSQHGHSPSGHDQSGHGSSGHH